MRVFSPTYPYIRFAKFHQILAIALIFGILAWLGLAWHHTDA